MVAFDAGDSLEGLAGNDYLLGGQGNDTLDGGIGVDCMVGGYGDDIFYVDNANDVVSEKFSDGGNDTVYASVSYSLDQNGTVNPSNFNGMTPLGNSVLPALEPAGGATGNYIENLVLTGVKAINGTGNDLDNVITGNKAANVLDGKAGIDTLVGGAGADTYIVDRIEDVIQEDLNNGLDLVKASSSYVLSDNLENLTLLGNDATNGTGNALNNLIVGNVAHNILDGQAGKDTLKGGKGDDTYIVDDSGDKAIELLNEGTDTVQASVNFTLGAQIENLVLTGSDHINGTGNTLNNQLTGNDGNNILSGGAGLDTMDGGLGDDIYCVDNVGDQVIENANQGTDTVKSMIDYVLGENVENLTLLGSAIQVTGNALDNILTGNTKNNILAGGLGNDTYIVQNVKDQIIETEINSDPLLEVDTVISSVSYTLGDNLETLVLSGKAHINATGNALNNVLIGNSGNNILNGGTGNDQMTGGAGNDTYIVDSAQDVITTELETGGKDTVKASISYALGQNLENLTLTGEADLDGVGNKLNNLIIGTKGANVLDGQGGRDTLQGGDGDDIYCVDDSKDVVIEKANQGHDIVQSSASYTLSANVEDLTLLGTENLSGTGNSLNNYITGNAGNCSLSGGAGNDTIWGQSGNDSLYGGAGMDLLYGGDGDDFLDGGNDTTIDVLFGGIGNDTYVNLSDLDMVGDSGGYDIINLKNYNYYSDSVAAIALDRYDSQGNISGDGNVDSLLLFFGNKMILIRNYFNNTSSTVEGSSAGYGLIEELQFKDGAITFTDIRDYLSGSEIIHDDGYSSSLPFPLPPAAAYASIAAKEDITEALPESGIIGTSDADSLYGSNGADSIYGLNANDSLYGFNGNDSLYGGGGADTMQGGVGNDWLTGGQGDDLLQDSSGDDTYVFELGDGLDRIEDHGGSINDRVLFGNSVEKNNVVFFMDVNGNLQIGYTNSSDVITVAGQTNADSAIDRFQLSDGSYLTQANVTQLVQDMTTWATNQGVTISSLDDVKNSPDLINIVNTSWHAA